jgi:hypothetical protein
LLVVPLVVPTDAVLRDAQAGLAAAVALIAQLCVVGVGFALGRRRGRARAAALRQTEQSTAPERPSGAA